MNAALFYGFLLITPIAPETTVDESLLTTTAPTIESIGTTTTTTTTVEEEETSDDGVNINSVPVTEQVMDLDIKISDVPDVDGSAEPLDLSWDRNKAIRDVAYFLRGHKFQEHDRRYYKSLEDSPTRFYQEFPRPALRSLHWEIRRHCQAGFDRCLKYLERIVKLTALRREDDTVTVMKERNWSLANNTEQVLAAQRDCWTAQKRDNLTMAPFQGPIERFQWRTSASYYMCWYTMLGVPELSIFGESCDNHANCLLEQGGRSGDPRADDTKPYACSLYSFCPDHCCPMKHIWYMKDCFQSPLNPCYDQNLPTHRKCSLNREQNQDFRSLLSNRINVSCECGTAGHEWSSRYGLCVDVNECKRGNHNCSWEDGEMCVNLPGRFECVCRPGFLYNRESNECRPWPILLRNVLNGKANDDERANITGTKSIFALLAKTIGRSAADDRRVLDHFFLLAGFFIGRVSFASLRLC